VVGRWRRAPIRPVWGYVALDELVVEPDAAVRCEDEEREPDAGHLPVELDDVCDAVDG